MAFTLSLAAAAAVMQPGTPAADAPTPPTTMAAADDTGGGDAAAKDVDISATLTLVSDYRFRGYSLSGRDPAVQAGVEASSVASGFYAGLWASSIRNTVGTNVELDVYGGWRGKAAGLNLDAGVTSYLYPGGKNANYAELLASAAKTIGPLEVKAGLAYAPDQRNLSGDNFYLYGQAKSGIPGTPLTLTALVGRESGSLAGPTGKKWDWSVGADAVFNRFTLGLKYVDTNLRRPLVPDGSAAAGVVVSLGVSF